VIEIDPDNANAYFNRGCCYDSVGELDLAISDYSVALELDMRNGGNGGEGGDSGNHKNDVYSQQDDNESDRNHHHQDV
jgi:tetratricopeptide (TPR) repeat protein